MQMQITSKYNKTRRRDITINYYIKHDYIYNRISRSHFKYYNTIILTAQNLSSLQQLHQN